MFGGDRCNVDQTSEASLSTKKQAFASIISSLIEAGYFRAAVDSLNDFDKVVGGLCWAITSSLIQVDVDILFEENATIGKRIKLSEDIVKVMRSMKCPHDLSAHQIQGSDFERILPVMTWLIVQVVEIRAKVGQHLKVVSQFHFNKDYELPDDINSAVSSPPP